MDSTNFEYTICSRHNPATPLTAELTCTEVHRKIVRLSRHETTALFLPEQTIVHHTSFIPLNRQNDVVDITRRSIGTTDISRSSKHLARISQIMRRFGVTNHACSTILRQIDAAIKSSSSRGVFEVKIWKIRTKVYDMDRATKRFSIERNCFDDSPLINSLRVFGYNKDNNFNGSTSRRKEDQCAICMEDYEQGSIMAELPCHHDFHVVCINNWFLKNHQCPLCRFPISY